MQQRFEIYDQRFQSCLQDSGRASQVAESASQYAVENVEKGENEHLFHTLYVRRSLQWMMGLLVKLVTAVEQQLVAFKQAMKELAENSIFYSEQQVCIHYVDCYSNVAFYHFLLFIFLF